MEEYQTQVLEKREVLTEQTLCCKKDIFLYTGTQSEQKNGFLGAFHSTKYSGLKFRVLHATNGTVFSVALD